MKAHRIMEHSYTSYYMYYIIIDLHLFIFQYILCSKIVSEY